MNISNKLLYWFMGWKRPDKYHPSIKCNCPHCSSITNLQGM